MIRLIMALLLCVCASSCSNLLSDEELQERYNTAYNNRNWENSKPLIDEIIKRNPDSAELHLSRALIASKTENRDLIKVVEDLSLYLTKYPNDDVIKTVRVQAYFLDNKLDLALKGINEVIASKGENAYLLAWKGNIAFANKQFDIAEQSYKERLTLEGDYEDLRNTYYYWVLSKYFGGNKESAMWEAAALQERGFEIDRPFLESIEKDQLDFNELADFKVPDVALSDIKEAIKNYCSDVNIFEDGIYFKSALINRFFRLEKTKNLDSLLKTKVEVYSLNLSYSNLKELPETLLQFKKLEYLNLSGNRFKDKEKLFNDLAKLPNLKILELNRCYLRALPDNIKNLKGLMMLSLTFNDFRELNENIGALTKLKYLDIGSNGKLRDLPQSIGDLRCLQMLDISPNGMRRLRDELANCSELVSIVANAGTIKTLPEDIGDLINLKHLNLAANKIIALPNSIGGLSSLEELSLGTNDIEVLPKSFSKLKKLDYCGLSYNRFKEFPKPVLGLKNVQNLWLHNNGFKTIPAEVANLPKLTHLLIDHEIITDENIKTIKSVNPELRVIREDSRKLVKGRKRKI